MKLLKNIFLVTLPTLLTFAIFLEVAARYILPTSDFPDVEFHKYYGNHFVPNQTGTYIRGESQQVKGRFRINAQGWNSPHDYEEIKPPGTYRIAVIGDSFVEALQVDYDQSFPYRMEKTLNENSSGNKFQVYSFGHSGANLVQNLEVFREVNRKYKPDLAIIILIHNDFLESFEGYGRVDNSTLRPANDTYTTVPPRPASTMELKRMFRKSAFVRYWVLNHSALEKFRFLRSWYYGDTRKVDANVSLTKIQSLPMQQFEHLAGYVFNQFYKQGQLTQTRVLIAMNTTAYSFEEIEDKSVSPVAKFNTMSKKKANSAGLPFLDLTDSFRNAWKKNPQEYKWKIDSHWNQHGHRVVAEAISQKILDPGIFLKGTGSGLDRSNVNRKN